MKTIFLVFGYLLICANISFSQTIINSGDVSGLWEKSKSPYQIFGEIEIPNNQTLTIEKGVKVEFQGHFKLNVQGRLLAKGEKLDSILFTGKDTTKWGGIRFVIVPFSNDTSKLSYCVVENCYASSGQLPRAATTDDYGGGIYVQASKLTINNSCIRNNKAYIAGGIFCADNNYTITNTIIRNNEAITDCGGLYLSMSNSKVIGCVITDNKADRIGGMRFDYANALLINNTICNNISTNPDLGSIFIRGNPKIFNTIIYYNTPSLIHIDDQGSYPEFQFCDIENGMAGFLDYYPSVKGYFDGIYKSNIETPPAFIDMQNRNYRLGISSCINTGNPDPMALIPKYDIDGNPRINNDSKARIDIGAYEYQSITPNRKPYCNNMDPQFFLRSQKSILAINYFDADPDDKLTFKATTNSSHVAVNILSVNDSTIITEIDPEINWRGECYVYININDNSNSTNSIGTDSIKVFISNRFKGDINTKVIFEDTVLIVGDVRIKELGDLEIRPGSFVEFQDWYKIKVLGKLNILGTKLNKVILNAADTAVLYYDNSNIRYERGWGGIEFIDVNRTETMFINYCDIKNTGINKEGNRENGTISITDSRNINFNNCSFNSNYLGGMEKKNSGIYAENSHNLQLKNCDFFDGYTFQYRGTYVNLISSDLVIDSCKFHDTDNNQGDFNWHCIVSENSAMQIRNSTFSNNIGTSLIASFSGSLIVENCIIKDNNSDGIETYTPGAIIRNNIIVNNRVGINCSSSAKIINNLIAYNTYKCGCSNFNGSAINLDHAGPVLIANNTIVNNYQDSNGNTVYSSYSRPTIVNNIFWNNIREGVGWYNGAVGIPNPIVKNNIIKGISDVSNFNINPSFRLKDSLDYSLLEFSSAINMALPDTTGLFLPLYDLMGNKRIDITSGRLDLGAYEYSGEYVTDIPKYKAIQTLTEFEIYPNPTSSVLYFSSEFNSEPYEILNLNGQIVQSGSIIHNSINVNLLIRNTYIIRIKYKNRYIRAKFAKI